MTFTIKRNDTSPSIVGTAVRKLDNTVIPITGATVRFHMGRIGETRLVDAAAAIFTDGSDGKMKYDWQAADTIAIGNYKAEFEVTFADGSIETFPNGGYIDVQITPDLGND
jgi:hypothetical protein